MPLHAASKKPRRCVQGAHLKTMEQGGMFIQEGKLLLHIEKFNKEITKLRISDPAGQ